MKITSGVEFDKHALKYWGFSTLNNVEMGDRVLVVLFQTFQGQWHQALGCFLFEGNVKGPDLNKLILEGLQLSGRAGLSIDAVICGGARWNRNMWSHFDVGEENNKCIHPCDDDRQLWFFSDFCHLLKAMTNNLCPLPPQKKE